MCITLMKLLYFFTSVCIGIAFLVSHEYTHAATHAVNIKSENTTIESKRRVSALREILYSSAMLFDYSKLAVMID